MNNCAACEVLPVSLPLFRSLLVALFSPSDRTSGTADLAARRDETDAGMLMEAADPVNDDALAFVCFFLLFDMALLEKFHRSFFHLLCPWHPSRRPSFETWFAKPRNLGCKKLQTSQVPMTRRSILPHAKLCSSLLGTARQGSCYTATSNGLDSIESTFIAGFWNLHRATRMGTRILLQVWP